MTAIRRGFSLIELLVVVSIIAVLAGMLVPSFALVRDAARSLQCAGNLRQLGVGMMSYASDANGRLPSCVDFTRCLSTNWTRLGGWDMALLDTSDGDLLPALRCPSFAGPVTVSEKSVYSGTTYVGTRSYSMAGARFSGSTSATSATVRKHVISWCINGSIPNWAAGETEGAMALSQIADSAGTLLLSERDPTGNAAQYFPGEPWTQMLQADYLATRHRGKAAAVFVDGHTEMITAAGSVGTGQIGYPYTGAKGMWTTDAGD